MRQIDWTDYRQSLKKNGYDTVKTVNDLCQKWQMADVLVAQREFNRRVDNADLREALQRQTCYLTSGSKNDIDLITKNGQTIAGMIKAGTKPKQ